MFFKTGITVFTAISQLAAISFVAAILFKKNIITKEQVNALSSATVNIFLPSLIAAKTLIRFQPDQFTDWWLLPVYGAALVFTGIGYSYILFRFKRSKSSLMALSGLQNGIYIVLPIGQVLIPEKFDIFALDCFLLVIGLNTLMWSIGKVMISGDKDSKIQLKDFMSPPLMAIFISVFLVLTSLSQFIPKPVISAMDLLGQATIPIAVFVLGATMASISVRKLPGFYDIFVVTTVKFALVPATVFSLLYFTGYYLTIPLISTMLIIQSTSPPATNLILIVENYGGDTERISSMMLIQYLVCIAAMPLWIAAWLYVTG